MNTTTPQLVQHPAGGTTLAVPLGGDSTVRIYVGRFDLAPRRRVARSRFPQKISGGLRR